MSGTNEVVCVVELPTKVTPNPPAIMNKFICIDVEVYPNRFMIGIRNTKGKHIIVDNLSRIRSLFEPLYVDRNNIWISFNGWKYDLPVIEFVLNNRDASFIDIYNFSKSIINDGVEAISWKKEHIDLYCLLPKLARCSLKEMGHRMGYKVLENLPYSYDKELTDEEWNHVKKYNWHDLAITFMLWEKLQGEYKARCALAETFGFHALWSGAAGLAKKVFKLKNVKMTHNYVKVNGLSREIEASHLYTTVYDTLLDESIDTETKIDSILKIGKNQEINGVKFHLSVGGFHNIPESGVYENIYEYDFQSLYPSMCIENNIGGSSFNNILSDLLETRLMYKKEGRKAQSDAYKLLINSITGCFRDEYAKDSVYSIESSLSMLLGGQFNMIDLIHRLPKNEVILSNTDSIFVRNKLPKEFLDDVTDRTGLVLEEDKYDKVIVSDVNSILCLRDGKVVKRKKEFLLPDLSHNVNSPIITKMVENYLISRTPFEETIAANRTALDYMFFKKIVKSKGTMLLDGTEVEDSKIRFYIAKKGGILERVTKKQRAKYVADSDVKMCMNIDDLEWSNVNYDWYKRRAATLAGKILKI